MNLNVGSSGFKWLGDLKNIVAAQEKLQFKSNVFLQRVTVKICEIFKKE